MNNLTSQKTRFLALMCPLAVCSASFAQTSDSNLTANQQATDDGILLLCRDELAPVRDELEGSSLLLFNRCGEIVRKEDVIGDEANALQRVQAEEIEILGSKATEGAGDQLANIGNRLQALRAGAMGLTVAGLNWDETDNTRGGMASGDDFSRLGAFISAGYADGDRDDSDNVNGFDFDTTSVTVGVDYRFTDNFVAGVAYHYLDSDSDIDSSTGGSNSYGDLEAEGNLFSVYATGYWENFYIEGSLGFGEYEFDSKRVVDYHEDSTFHENLEASPDGDQFNWSLGGGYVANSGALTHSYYAMVHAVDLEIDDYTEKTDNPENGSMAMTVDDQDIDSLRSELGVQLSWNFSPDFGVMFPYLDVSWIHEFEDGDDPITTRYANADGLEDLDVDNQIFTVLTDSYDEDYFRLSLGVGFAFSGGLQAFINYDTLLELDDYTYNAITAGIRKEF